MREYSRFSGRFWTGPTGRAIKAKGRDAQVLAVYLFTGPSSNMIGLYYLPLVTLCHEAGFTPDEARSTLAVLADIDFAFYDESEELVWVPQAANYQVGESLAPEDNRAKGVKNLLKPFQRHRFGRQFIVRYRRPYSLHINDDAKDLVSPSKGPSRTLEAPSKPGEGTGSGAGPGTERPTPLSPRKRGGSTGLAAAPEPPANGHGSPARQDLDSARTRLAHQVELARQFAVDQRLTPSRKDLGVFRAWFKAGLTLADVQSRIERGDHLARRTPDGGVYQPLVEIPSHLGSEEVPLMDLDSPDEDAQPPPPGPAAETTHQRRKP